jgi:hypothetical protein
MQPSTQNLIQELCGEWELNTCYGNYACPDDGGNLQFARKKGYTLLLPSLERTTHLVYT